MIQFDCGKELTIANKVVAVVIGKTKQLMNKEFT